MEARTVKLDFVNSTKRNISAVAFNRVLNKALQVAQQRGMETGEHFNQVVEMVKLDLGTFRKMEKAVARKNG